MNDDLISQLRNPKWIHTSDDQFVLDEQDTFLIMNKAADEIERLQIEANALRQRLNLTYDIQVGVEAAGSPTDTPATPIKWDISR